MLIHKVLLILGLCPFAIAQFYTFSTVAGSGRPQFSAGGPATSAKLIQPTGVAADADGNFFVADTYYNQVFRVSPEGTIRVFAGNGTPGFSGDGGPAASAQLFNPNHLAVDAAGNLYIADFSNSRIRKVTPAGIISTVAGNGQEGTGGDGGSATLAQVGGPHGVTVDSSGNLYITEPTNQVIRKVDTNGTISRIAGNGSPGFSGDGGPALSAMVSHPQGIRVDSAGNIYFSDNYNHRVRMVSPQGTISTFAGNGTPNFAGDGGRATSASLFFPTDVAFDSSGKMYIADATNTRIRVVSSGSISTFAGGGVSLTDGQALQAALQVPTALAFDSRGNLLMTLGYLRQVRSVTSGGTIRTAAGALLSAATGDGGLATAGVLLDPFGIASDKAGNLFIADQFDNRIRKVSSTGTITTLGGNGVFGSAGDGGPAVGAQLGYPRAMTVDPQGNAYVTTPVGALVRRITPGGTISTFAGNGRIAAGGDNIRAIQASLNGPLGLGSDAQGNIYISDAGEARIRRVDTGGTISTIAGTGEEGYSGDGGSAVLARIYQPRQIATDKQGNVYFADESNNRVRKVIPGGTIATVAGNGTLGSAGDGGPATAAQLAAPTGVALDDDGNIYIAAGTRIRKVNAATGVISTIAGFPGGSNNVDGVLATLANFTLPFHIAVDGAGVVYVTDKDSQRVRGLTPVQIVREGVVNGATFVAGGVAPGEIVTIYSGPNINLGPAAGTGLQVNEFGRVSTIIGGIQALFDGVAAPLTYVNANQINAVVPYSVAGKATTQLQVMIQGKPTNTVNLNVVDASPGVFAITNSNGSVNSASNPSTDRVLVIYATGEGKTIPAVADGTVNSTVFPKPALPVTVLIGGQEATVLYAGAAPGFVAGVLQLNVQIPASVTGTVPVQVKIGSAATPAGLTISVQ